MALGKEVHHSGVAMLSLISLLYVATASANPVFSDEGFVFTGSSGTYSAGGVGAPTVAYDSTNGQYVMYFEYKTATTPSDCASSYGIGRATSPDGVTWTQGASPVIIPSASSAAMDHCVVSQPAIVYDEDTGVWHMLYTMAGKKPTAAATYNNEYGIAYATSTDGVAFATQSTPVIPKSGAKAPSMASAVILDRTLTVIYVDYPNLKKAEYNLDSGTWSIGTSAVVDKSKLAWTSQWALSPALICDGALDLHGWPDSHGLQYGMLFGGDTAAGVRTLGLGLSTTGEDWFVSMNTTASPATSLNHWDILRSGEDYLMWYSKDYSGTVKGIGLATADENADGTWDAPSNKYCPLQ